MASLAGMIGTEARLLMHTHGVSYRTGFLAENPLEFLPHEGICRRFCILDELACWLPRDIKAREIVGQVKDLNLRISDANFFKDLPEPILYRLMLIYAMYTHAYFRELLGYKNIGELMQDDSIKILPAQLAVPLWKLSKLTGIAPSLSYCLYALQNPYFSTSDEKVCLENFKPLHTFTGTQDETWFIAVHQYMEYLFAPAVPALLKAYLLSLMPFEDIPPELMTQYLGVAARASARTVDILERMREQCDPHTSFDRVRLFYGMPRNVVFEGVEELNNEPQEILGETGGHTPLQHFRLMALGMNHEDIPYFPLMRKHMPAKFRSLVERVKNSRIREYVMWAHNRNNEKPARRYNQLVWSVIDHRREHLSLVEDYISTHGETHGTGKPPLDWLKPLYERTKTYLIW